MIQIKQIDGLRCLAIGMVLATHWGLNTVLPVATPFAPMGVNLFFVISGFLITLILLDLKEAREEKNVPTFQLLKTFYLRRSLRIFPIYYLSIFVCLLLGIVPVYEIWGWLVTYTLNLGVSFAGVKPAGFGIYWSLAVEEQFYLFFPLLILLFPRKHLPKLFVVMIVTAVVSRFVFNQIAIDELKEGTISYQFTLCCLDTFGFGALAAYYFRYSSKKLARFIGKCFWLPAVFLLLFLLTEFMVEGFSGATTLGRFFFSGACFGIIGKASVEDNFTGLTGQILENPVVLYIGKISYGIYVYHNFVSEFVEYYFGEAYLKVLIKLLCTIFIAAVSWHIFELPINRLKRKFPY